MVVVLSTISRKEVILKTVHLLAHLIIKPLLFEWNIYGFLCKYAKKKGSSEFKIKQDVVTAECILEIKMNRWPMMTSTNALKLKLKVHSIHLA